MTLFVIGAPDRLVKRLSRSFSRQARRRLIRSERFGVSRRRVKLLLRAGGCLAVIGKARERERQDGARHKRRDSGHPYRRPWWCCTGHGCGVAKIEAAWSADPFTEVIKARNGPFDQVANAIVIVGKRQPADNAGADLALAMPVDPCAMLIESSTVAGCGWPSLSRSSRGGLKPTHFQAHRMNKLAMVIQGVVVQPAQLAGAYPCKREGSARLSVASHDTALTLFSQNSKEESCSGSPQAQPGQSKLSGWFALRKRLDARNRRAVGKLRLA